MKVIPPLFVTDAKLTSSSVPETDATVWSAATAYALGQLAMRTTGVHRVYRRLVAGTSAATPESDPINWLDLGSTNRWRMLRADANVRTTGTSPVVILITPGERISAVGIVGVVADTVKIEQLDATDTVVLTITESLATRITLTWFDYFFGDFKFKASFLSLALLPITGSKLRVTLTRAAGDVSCGPVIVGNSVDLGKVQNGATAGVVDFSTVERDPFGNPVLLKRKAVPRTSQESVITRAQVPAVRQALTALGAQCALYVG
ncbi:MAG: hypothetical protein EOO22_08265, partial [Comamonadaceae bacterium]